MSGAYPPEAEVETFVAALGARMGTTDDALGKYDFRNDAVLMRPRAFFQTSGVYYATLLHEHAHWTSHESRLARTLGRSYEDPLFAMEELCAIVATIHLCLFFGIEKSGVEQQVDYSKRWLPLVNGDRAGIRYAVDEGRRAATYLCWLASGGTRRGYECLSREGDNLVLLHLQCWVPPLPYSAAQMTAWIAAAERRQAQASSSSLPVHKP